MPKFNGNPDGRIERYSQKFQDALLNDIHLKTDGGRWKFNRFIMRTGRRGGKTETGAIATSNKASRLPGMLSWAAAPTFPKMEDYVFPALEKAIPRAWIKDWAAQNWTLTLRNNHVIKLRSLDDIERGRGPGIDWLWIDEGREVDVLAWKTLEPAIRDTKGQALVTTTPKGRDWCDRLLFQLALKNTPGYWATKYRTIDNPKFSVDPELRAEVEEARATSDPLWFAQEYEGEVVTFAGSVYGDALESQIIRDNEEAGLQHLRRLIPEWPKISGERYSVFGLDPGTDHPFAGAFLVQADNGDIVVAGEYLHRDRPVNVHVRSLRSVLDGFDPGAPPEPSMWAIDKSQAQTGIELSVYGISAVGAPNSVENGIRRVQGWLAVRRMWFVESRVPKTIEQFRNYRWAEEQEDHERRRERVIKLDDDLPDAVRYGVMVWPDMPTVGADEDELKQRRPLSDVPSAVRWQVERMRRIDDREHEVDDFDTFADVGRGGMLAEDPDDPFADFWGTGGTA